MLDLQPQYLELKTELDAAVLGVLAGGKFILGPEVAAFEKEFAAYIGADYGIGVANGTDALDLAVAALGLSTGDEVLTTAFSFIATADSFARSGVSPAFADIDPRTFNLDPKSVAERLTPRTKAIIAVHIFGQPADMDPLLEIGRDHGIPVLEDSAQSHGAVYRGRTVGSIGAASTFSFFPTKPLGGAGDGGIVCTTTRTSQAESRCSAPTGPRENTSTTLSG